MATQQKRKAWRLLYPEHVAYLTGPFPWGVVFNCVTSPVVGYGLIELGMASDSMPVFLVLSLTALAWCFLSFVNMVGMVWMRHAFRNVSGYRARKIREAEDAADAEAWLKSGGDQDRIDAILKRTPNP